MNSSDDYDSEQVLEENFIDCGVKDMTALHLKTNITTLSLHCNNILMIKGLQNMVHLRHLDISSNMISKISGLEALISLRTLNMSCNRLKKVEGLCRLKQLVRLDVSYNEINDLSGLGDLGNVCGHPLTVLEIRSNQLRLISQVINNCQKLTNLRQITLLNNPMCAAADYRTKVMRGLTQLRILDGKDRNGQEVEINILSDIPGLEQFMDYLSSSTEPYSEVLRQKECKTVPVTYGDMCVATKNDDKHMSGDHTISPPQSELELKQRLQDLEEKLTKFVTEKQDSANVAPSNVTEGAARNKKFRNKSHVQEDKDNSERSDRSDLKIAKLMKELDQERHYRLDRENKLQLVVTRYKELQLTLTNDRKSKEDAIKATEKLTSAFSREKSMKEELEQKLMDVEKCWHQRNKELLDCKKRLEFSHEDIKSKMEIKEKELMNKSEEMLQMTRSIDELKLKLQVGESNLASVRKHCNNLEEQTDNIQSTLSRREKEYQLTLANRFSIDSKELQDYTQTQVNAVKEQGQFEINSIKEKLSDSNSRYKALEDEFRLALHMEADRYDKLEHSYRQLLGDMTSLKHRLDLLSKKETDSQSLIGELTTVVKDQKVKLNELSKNRQEKNKDNKERILSLEAHLEEARKQMLHFELTKQENKKLLAKQSAQESVIEGLKAERKLWSEELAQQGYLLTQDRAKLECKIEAQNSDISRIKMELEREVESGKCRSKMIEDQTATIFRLKEGLVEKDHETRAFGEKLLDDQKELESRTKLLMKENDQYKEIINKLTARKEELKDVIGNLEEKLDDALSSQDSANQKWKEKSELISKLEGQVVHMKDYWEKKTDDLTEERNEAVEKYRELRLQFDGLENGFRSQLEMAYKNKDFIKQEADERIESVENEMRKLLVETKEEKRRLQARMQILNRAIAEVDSDKRA